MKSDLPYVVSSHPLVVACLVFFSIHPSNTVVRKEFVSVTLIIILFLDLLSVGSVSFLVFRFFVFLVVLSYCFGVQDFQGRLKIQCREVTNIYRPYGDRRCEEDESRFL